MRISDWSSDVCSSDLAVVVPVKAFSQAKVRLTPRLDPATRAELARAMEARVLRAAGTLPTSVVCDDDEVAAWAQRHGAEVIWKIGRESGRERVGQDV